MIGVLLAIIKSFKLAFWRLLPNIEHRPSSRRSFGIRAVGCQHQAKGEVVLGKTAIVTKETETHTLMVQHFISADPVRICHLGHDDR
jgi:hypothetical protein